MTFSHDRLFRGISSARDPLSRHQQNISKPRILFQFLYHLWLFPGPLRHIIARGRSVGASNNRAIFILLATLALSLLTDLRGSDLQGWIDISDSFDLTPKLQLGGDGGYRQSIDGSDFRVIYGRSTLNYELTPALSVLGGVGLFYNWEPLSVLETRPWVGLLIDLPRFSRVSFSHLLRLEERLIDIEGIDGKTEIGRLRYRFKAVIPLNRPADEQGSLYIPTYFEIAGRLWGDLPTGFISAGRLSGGLGFRISRDWRVEVTYHQQRAKLTSGGDYIVDEHVIRLQIRGW